MAWIWIVSVVATAAVSTALVSWYLGWSFDWLRRPLSSAGRDAGERLSDSAAEFRDWLRLGR